MYNIDETPEDEFSRLNQEYTPMVEATK